MTSSDDDGSTKKREVETGTKTTENPGGSVTVTDTLKETVTTEYPDNSTITTVTQITKEETTLKNTDGSVNTTIKETEMVKEVAMTPEGREVTTETKTEVDTKTVVKPTENPDGSFGVLDVLSRQELATALYRFAKSAGYDVSERADLGAFADADEVADYAREAMEWAVAVGRINGTADATLDPAGSATRAQFAAVITRFVCGVRQAK